MFNYFISKTIQTVFVYIFSWSLDQKRVFWLKSHVTFLWGFWFDLSIGSKHFSFHVSIFLLQGLPSARLAIKTSQHENWKHFSSIEKSHQSSQGMKNTNTNDSNLCTYGLINFFFTYPFFCSAKVYSLFFLQVADILDSSGSICCEYITSNRGLIECIG